MKITSAGSTPYVSVDYEAGVIHISGRSTPFNAGIFFLPLYEMIKIIGEEQKTLTLNFDLEYADNESCNSICGIIRKVEELQYRGLKARVNWNYESNTGNSVIKDLGRHLSDNHSVNIEFNKTSAYSNT
ncbi:MAG: SiaC family regulatory phosphoprotein [Cyclobacteriaceae bacterium]